MKQEASAASWADRKRLASVLERNIRALDQRRAQEEATAGFQDRLAQAVTRATGSLAFVYLHLLLFGGWILINLGVVPYLPRSTRLSRSWRWQLRSRRSSCRLLC